MFYAYLYLKVPAKKKEKEAFLEALRKRLPQGVEENSADKSEYGLPLKGDWNIDSFKKAKPQDYTETVADFCRALRQARHKALPR